MPTVVLAVAEDEVVGAPHRVEPADLGRERHLRAARRSRRVSPSPSGSISPIFMLLMLASRVPRADLPLPM